MRVLHSFLLFLAFLSLSTISVSSQIPLFRSPIVTPIVVNGNPGIVPPILATSPIGAVGQGQKYEWVLNIPYSPNHQALATYFESLLSTELGLVPSLSQGVRVMHVAPHHPKAGTPHVYDRTKLVFSVVAPITSLPSLDEILMVKYGAILHQDRHHPHGLGHTAEVDSAVSADSVASVMSVDADAGLFGGGHDHHERRELQHLNHELNEQYQRNNALTNQFINQGGYNPGLVTPNYNPTIVSPIVTNTYGSPYGSPLVTPNPYLNSQPIVSPINPYNNVNPYNSVNPYGQVNPLLNPNGGIIQAQVLQPGVIGGDISTYPGAPVNPDALNYPYHNTLASCWVLYYDTVYDITAYVGAHPGGRLAYDMTSAPQPSPAVPCGSDGTSMFQTSPHGQANDRSVFTRAPGVINIGRLPPSAVPPQDAQALQAMENANPNNLNGPTSSGGTNWLMIGGIIAGGVVALILVVATVSWCCRRRTNKYDMTDDLYKRQQLNQVTVTGY